MAVIAAIMVRFFIVIASLPHSTKNNIDFIISYALFSQLLAGFSYLFPLTDNDYNGDE